VHGALSSLFSPYDINSAAASMRFYALKPASKPCCGPDCWSMR
jgi:arsenite methyltransferase